MLALAKLSETGCFSIKGLESNLGGEELGILEWLLGKKEEEKPEEKPAKPKKRPKKK